ncbi:hypothetical protein GCM10027340_17210 [Marinomonas epiphytica]
MASAKAGKAAVIKAQAVRLKWAVIKGTNTPSKGNRGIQIREFKRRTPYDKKQTLSYSDTQVRHPISQKKLGACPVSLHRLNITKIPTASTSFFKKYA